jgi:hypothetical protein
MKYVPICRLFTIALTIALPPAGSRATATHAGSAGLRFDDIPSCHLPAGATARSDEKDMPAPLRDAVKKKLGYLAPPNVPFDATDVVTTGHNRRLIFIWARGNVWVVATEHGGRGYNDPILAYQLDPRDLKVTLIAERIAVPKTVCATSEELLNQQSCGTHAP